MNARVAIPLELPKSVHSELTARAIQMRGGEAIPVFLRDVCAALKISVRRDKRVPAGKAYLQWNRELRQRPVILLPTKHHPTWDRFCAAHELGHYVLISTYDWIPEDKKNYWRTELLCDYFARQLLIPERLLNGARDGSRSPNDWLQLCDGVSTRALVPWLQAAHGISDIDSNIVFLRVDQTKDALHVSGSTLSGKRGTGMPLSNDLPLTEKLRSLSMRAELEKSVVFMPLERDDFRGTKLAGPIREFGATKISAQASPHGRQIRLAITT